MKRKLARIEKIGEILPIEGADVIEAVIIGGWKVVVRKDEGFKKGDLVMFFEIDAYLPIEPRYEFLRKYSYKKLDFKDGNPEGLREEGFRLKTVKLRGVYSQGLVMPLTAFKDEIGKIPISLNVIKDALSKNLRVDNAGTLKFNVPLDSLVGMDFTGILDVKVFTKPIPIEEKGKVKGMLPFSIPETEQERIQNLPEYFEEMMDIPFEETEKVNGKSMTTYHNNGEIGVCKRNWELVDDDDNLYWKIAKDLDLEGKLKEMDLNIALQGEAAGEGINKNPLGLVGKHYFIFNIWDIEKRRFLTFGERIGIVNELGLEHVPIINEEIKIFQEYSIERMDDLVARSRGKSWVTTGKQREGIVFKSTVLINGQTVSFKVLDNKQVMKEENDDG